MYIYHASKENDTNFCTAKCFLCFFKLQKQCYSIQNLLSYIELKIKIR